MGQPIFNSDAIGVDGYLVFSGKSTPKKKTLPRTIGGLICASGIVDKDITLKTYVIPPVGTSRSELECYFNQLNERIVNKQATLAINGNTYPNMVVANTKYDLKIVNSFCTYEVNFKMNNQNNGTVRQLTPSQFLDFSRGRKATFCSVGDDYEQKEFTIWHNVDMIRDMDVELKQKKQRSLGAGADYVYNGGFERVQLRCWGIFENRQSVEAYFYNMLNGPLGTVGTLQIDGQTLTNAFFASVSSGTDLGTGINYDLEFLIPLQC